MSNRPNQTRGELSAWILPVIALMVFPPVGVLLIVFKLLGRGKSVKQGQHPYYAAQQRQAPAGARTTAQTASGAAGRQQAQMAALAANAKRLTICGGVLTGIFALTALSGLGDAFYWLLDGEFKWFVQDLMEMLPVLCFLGGGLGCLWAGVQKRKQLRRFRNYLVMIGAQQSVAVDALSSATGSPAGQVRNDLQDMLDRGLLPIGYLDYRADTLVLSAEGLRQEPTPQQKKQAAPTAPEENAILAEIREVNDQVDDEKLSAQIDRIGVITAKILDYQKQHPEKAAQLHSFLSYYLPTTLKILRAYGQLEDQEISGENITAAMQRIERMMDKVVEGFEKQLDQLFQSDTMDITTDVEVLERMMAKDGLSSDQGLTLGT